MTKKIKNLPLNILSFSIVTGLFVLFLCVFTPVDSANGICSYDKERLSLIMGDRKKLEEAKEKFQKYKEKEDSYYRNLPPGVAVARRCSEPKSPGYDLYII